MADENKTITWQAPEFRYYEKNIGWYITLLAVSVLLIGFFIIQNDLFAAITTGIVTVFIILFSRHRPEIVTVQLNSKGVKYGNIIYPYKQLKYFWVVHNQNHQTINFVSTTYVNNTIIIELENESPDEVREYLLQFLPEHHETGETTIQKITHKLKF